MDGKYIIINTDFVDHLAFTDAVYLHEQNRPTTAYWDLERAQKELIRLKSKYPKRDFVLYEAKFKMEKTGIDNFNMVDVS